ncbi:MAG: NADH:ubiquinone reductase (Na(+)-transporting) subunit F [Tannerellaceae bacterium]|nr:NADH:ubiquinone reductase (Na(+)-transporting) subunit F [Tannerellaceae bacterium]
MKELTLQLPEGESYSFEPGSHIQVHIPPYAIRFDGMDIDARFHPDWDAFKVWELTCINEEEAIHTYSMANYPEEGNIIKLNVRVATPPVDRQQKRWQAGMRPGIASSYLFTLKPGDRLTVSAPYGNFHIRESVREMLYIGGGSGMAPLRGHLMHLFKTLKTTDRKVNYWYGARSKNEMFYEEEFREIEKDFPNFRFHVALSAPLPEDKWDGYTGFIHQVILDNYLKEHPAPHSVEYYICGPPPMAQAAKGMLNSLGVPEDMILGDDF